MNYLTTLYVHQADREHKVAEDLRNRQVLQVDPHPPADATRAAANATQPATSTPRRALQVRATGR